MNTNKIVLVFALIFSTFASAQVGIGTQNPQGFFNVDGAKDNATSGTPTAPQQLNDFTVLANGNTGIGTTDPNQKLQVVGNINFSGALMPNNAAGTAGQVLTSAGAGAVPTWATPAGVTNIYNTDGTLTGNRVVTQGANSLTFSGAGNVGLGITPTVAKLDVASSLAATNTVNANAKVLRFSRPATANSKWNNIAQFDLGSYEVVNNPTITDSKTRLDLTLNDLNNATLSPVMTWQGNGNVGIGTTAPTQKLDVVGAGLFRNGNDSGQSSKDQILMSYNTQSNFAHAIKTRHSASAANDNAIDFYSWNQGVDANSAIGTKHVMSLLGNGNVGIGTTNPSNRLHVSGNALFAPRTANTGGTAGEPISVEIYGKSPAGTASQVGGIKMSWYGASGGIEVLRGGGAYGVGLGFNVSPNVSSGTTFEAMRIMFNGNVGIGTTDPLSKLHVVGLPVHANNATAIGNGLTAGAFYHNGDGVVRVVY